MSDPGDVKTLHVDLLSVNVIHICIYVDITIYVSKKRDKSHFFFFLGETLICWMGIARQLQNPEQQLSTDILFRL